ncbi:HKD family nuclease [Variovorax paradoxus]|uniref:phospholipase D family protein n=1 Tax=Variovorax paradoxus TaxID=34073 RepID=UPI00339A041B
MKVSVLTAEQATHTLLQLLRDCVRFDVAVAWAGSNPVADAMLKMHPKLGKVVIGTHMYQTDPAVLRAFMPRKGARCLPPSGRLFHPKVYLFETAMNRTAVVGSHNLTAGAFGGKNIEVSTLLEGKAEDEALIDLKSFIESTWHSAEAIDEDTFLFAYETQYRINKAKRSALDKFYRLKKPRIGAKSSPMTLTWKEFVEGVKNDVHHSLEGRLAILERATTLFLEHRSLAVMSRFERKAIAGTYGEREPQLDDLEWPWFGTMFGQGDFKNLINESPKLLSAALDHIPAEGEILEEQFDGFAHDFSLAFQGKSHKGGVPTASRLLAMKRPDFFIGVNDANRTGICSAFGNAPTTLALENYWERIVIPMQNSPWWLCARPRAQLEGRIWDNRAALLDSIYYDPTAKRKSKKKL